MVVLANRAKMATATTGTGTITLGAAVADFQTFGDAGVVDADIVRYVIEDGADWEIGTGTYTATGTLLTRTVSESSNADSALNLTGSAVVFIGATAEDFASILKTNETANLTAAYTAAVDDDGTQTSGTYTPTTAAGSNYKKIINGGAHTIAPPTLASDTATTLALFIVNNASAGAITLSGFNKVIGDAFTTTNGHEFLCHVEVFDIAGTEFSLLNVVAMQ
jgi:hypothetical protein